MNIHCPKCHSERVGKINFAKKGMGTLGVVAGTAGGVSSVVSGARIGSTVGLVAGPGGSVTGAIVGGLLGAVAGGTVGAAVGEIIDDTVLDNFECFECQHRFSHPTSRQHTDTTNEESPMHYGYDDDDFDERRMH